MREIWLTGYEDYEEKPMYRAHSQLIMCMKTKRMP